MGFLAPIAAFAAAHAAEIAVASTVVAAAGTGYAAYSQHQQASYQAKVAKNNAEIAEQNRQAALAEGAAEASIARTETGRRISGALAEQAAAGLDVGYGTPFEIQGALRNEGDLDAMTIQYNTSRRALGFAQQRSDFLSSAKNYKSTATGALVGGALDVGRTILSGANSLGRNQLRMQTAGSSLTGG